MSWILLWGTMILVLGSVKLAHSCLIECDMCDLTLSVKVMGMKKSASNLRCTPILIDSARTLYNYSVSVLIINQGHSPG